MRTERDDVPWLVTAGSGTVVLVVAAVRALAEGVQLIDERAWFELRARDVLSADHPLLGLASSASGAGGDLNHPGPLFFDYLAIPVRLFGGAVGTTIAVVALHVGCLWMATLAARRVGGPLVATTVAAAGVVLAWTLGSDLLIDPWQPNVLVLPAYALLAATAATAAGNGRWLPVVVVLASLCAQTHLGDVVLAPALVAVAGLVLAARRGQAPVPTRTLATSALLALVLWAQPLWQQFFGAGPGNLGRVLSGAGGASDRYGAGIALRLVAAVVVVPPAWLRPSFDTDPPQALTRVTDGTLTLDESRLPSLAVSVLVLALLAAAGALLAVAARRRRVAGAGPLLAAVAAALVASFLTLVVMPTDLFGVLVHKYRFLWPVAAFTAAAVVGVAGGVARAAGWRWAQALAPAAAAAAVLAAVANIPTRDQTEGGQFARREIWPVVADLRHQVADADIAGPVVVDTDTPAFPDYYLANVVAELDRQGIDVQVSSDAFVGQVGRSRRADGSAATALAVRSGTAVDDAPAGSRVVARVDADRPELAVAVYAGPTGPGG